MADEAMPVKRRKFNQLALQNFKASAQTTQLDLSGAMFAETAFGGAPIKGKAQSFILLQTSIPICPICAHTRA
ncbi:hypothetical protein [uncultured Campylobacter sp.]|uniref:hypothetical protein n=1 Tax=uncultured Campylobacter sp. TaxID=218934 RepID=UPI00262D79CD|nr:hypothetical protein [uncultured Campylobacter sp.]